MNLNQKNRYIIDTNIYGLALSNKHPQLNKFLNKIQIDDYLVSCFVMAELEVLRYSTYNPNLYELLFSLEKSEVIWFDQNDLEYFANLKNIMNHKKIKNRTIDWFIAAQCLKRKCIIVTANKKDFEHIPNLESKFYDQKNFRWYK